MTKFLLQATPCPHAPKLKVMGHLTPQIDSVCLCNKYLCDKYLHTHKAAQRDNGRWGNSINTLPQLLQALSQEPSAHHRSISTIPEEHRAQRQAGTQIKDSEEGTSCLGASQGCPRRPSAPLSRYDTHNYESMLEQLLDRGE